MIKTQIQLEEWQYEAVKRSSASSCRSMSEIIREGVTLFLNKQITRPPLQLEELAGKYRPISSDDLKAHDRAFVGSIR